MKLRSAAIGLIAGAALAFGITAGGAPAAAQEAPLQTPQGTPWYMPQPWVHPPQTGPKVRMLPGYYGHGYRRSYGSFGNYCYGSCRELPGTVATRGGVILSQPVVAIFDPDAYQVVPRAQYPAFLAAAPQPAPAPKPVTPLVVSVSEAAKAAQQREPDFAMQNGVRIFRPSAARAE